MGSSLGTKFIYGRDVDHLPVFLILSGISRLARKGLLGEAKNDFFRLKGCQIINRLIFFVISLR